MAEEEARHGAAPPDYRGCEYTDAKCRKRYNPRSETRTKCAAYEMVGISVEV